MAGQLVLGTVLFRNFELPEQIAWGGAQRLHVHKLPGGGRVIDAMGRDDGEIVWSGTFSGPDAGQRARLVDLLRSNGDAVALTWDRFFYSVYIAQFHAEYAQANWIPYRIVCSVLRDEAAATTGGVISVATDIAADLATADGFASGVDLTQAIALTGVANAVTRGTASYTAAGASLALAASRISTSLAVNEATFGASAAGATMNIGQITALCGEQSGLVDAQSYVRRAQANLAIAST